MYKHEGDQRSEKMALTINDTELFDQYNTVLKLCEISAIIDYQS